MINLFFALFSTLAVAAPAVVPAEPAAQQEAPAAAIKQQVDKKSTDMSFDELLVQGKYHFTDEAVTTVENDKILDGLLEVRKNFRDRIEQSAARY